MVDSKSGGCHNLTVMASESSNFDPYHKWFGIPPDEQPPHHYRLLRIAVFESDPDVIDNAYDTAMAQLKRHEVGEHGDFVEQLGRELLAARRCLLSPEKKSQYDQTLREQLSPEASPNRPPAARPTSPPPLASTRSAGQQRPEIPTRMASSASPTAYTEVPRPDLPRKDELWKRPPRRRLAFRNVVVLNLIVGGLLCAAVILIVIGVGRSLSDDTGEDKSDSSHAGRATDDWSSIDWTKHGIRQWGSEIGKDEIVVKKEVSPNSWLLSRRVYDDFVLTAQYSVEEGGAGGIYVRVPPDARFPWTQGFEVHFDDDYGQPPSLDGTGSVYKRAQPSANRARPVNQWNDVRIECRGRDLLVWLNGEQVVDYRTPDAFDKSGHIGLDGVTGGITYRNVRVRWFASEGKQ